MVDSQGLLTLFALRCTCCLQLEHRAHLVSMLAILVIAVKLLMHLIFVVLLLCRQAQSDICMQEYAQGTLQQKLSRQAALKLPVHKAQLGA